MKTELTVLLLFVAAEVYNSATGQTLFVIPGS